ncbi:hypothetical protein CARUB_v10018019mg [Capsella rubella]|uniref:Uncharacterized protein n=1 Tax=Capsella rubella TaxID=81985 RepID=R0FQA3_9BRAS|nr:uncharacterized protein LOC17885383 [Capsella rubella]EOA24742.1 hypothetical protein CARUB_v10018019mg [Capsella rubella]
MGLSQTAAVLVAVFAFCLVAVTAQLAYVLWWKRRFRRRSIAGSELDVFSSRGGDPTATPPPSKELLYFFLFCLENKQLRIGGTATAPPLPPAAPPVNDVTSSKWSTGENILSGPSESLFTIAEDCTSESDHRTVETEARGNISTEDLAKEDEVVEEIILTDGSDDEVDFSDYNHDGTTPFSTPCASPPFYTPSPSPIRDDLSKTIREEILYG